LQIETAGKGLRIPFGGLARFIEPSAAQRPRDFAAEASREHDQPFGIFGEDLFVDARLVIQPLLISGGKQPTQILIPNARLGEQNQMEIAAAFDVVAALGLAAISPLARRETALAADNRFDAALPGLLKKFDRAEHVAVIGYRDRGHPGA